MRIRKKTFAGIIFAVAFVLMVSISALALWTNDVISFKTAEPVNNETLTDNTLYPAAAEDGLWGYVNSAGEMVVEAEYDRVEFFLGNTAWVQKDGLWGAVDSKGQQIIDCVYPEKYQLDDNLYKICVAVNGHAQSVYNSKGEKIFGIDNGEIGHMDGGLISFSRAIDGVQHWGYIDTTGKVVIAPSYKSVGAVGLTHAVAQTFDDEMVLVKRSDGTETPLPDNVDLDGLGSNMLLYHENGLYGYLDMNGQTAIPARFVRGDTFSNNLALVQTDSGYGLINESGDFVVPAEYKFAENLGNGYYMFGDSAVGTKTVYDKNGKAVMNDVIGSGDWFNGYLNLETERQTKFIQADNGPVNNVVMNNNSNAFYYGSRICVYDENTKGVAYYDLSGNLLETYGQNIDIGNDCSLTSYWEAPDAYLEICYPEITTANSNLQDVFAEISERLKENALSDYSRLYRDSDGSVNYMVKGSFEYAVSGSVVTVLQKTRFIDEEAEEEYEVLCFDFTSGEMYDISSLFAADVNWQTDLGGLLVASYKKQCTDFSKDINDEAVRVLSEKLNRNTGFLLEAEGMKIFIDCGGEPESVFLTYEEMEPFIDAQSKIWLNMNGQDAQ